MTMKRVLSGQPDFSDAECEAAARVLRSGWVGPGPEVDAFEDELAAYASASHVVTVSSCTAALMLSLKVLGVGPGDEVVCPTLTWVADANAIVALGARAVFCDVDPKTFTLSPATVLPRVTERTKAVIAVHYGGFASDPALLRAALPASVAIVEDAAHALGAHYPNGSPVGSSGNLTCFSFHANKSLSTVDGGAVALHDPEHAGRIAVLRQQGIRTTSHDRLVSDAPLAAEFVEPGYKMVYSDLAAAIGRVQLRRQPEFAEHRLALARTYTRRVDELSLPLEFQEGLLTEQHARHLLAVLVPSDCPRNFRDELRQRLRSLGIHAGIHYEPLHHQSAFGEQSPLPVADELFGRLISLPIGPRVTHEDATACIDHVAESFGGLTSSAP